MALRWGYFSHSTYLEMHQCIVADGGVKTYPVHPGFSSGKSLLTSRNLELLNDRDGLRDTGEPLGSEGAEPVLMARWERWGSLLLRWYIYISSEYVGKRGFSSPQSLNVSASDPSHHVVVQQMPIQIIIPLFDKITDE